MESKTARLTVLVDPEKKKAFEQLCARQDRTPSQVVRQLIRDYLADHGVTYGSAPVIGGQPASDASLAEPGAGHARPGASQRPVKAAGPRGKSPSRTKP